MNILIASDHGGFELKSKIIKEFSNKGINFIDLGTNNKESVDYVDYAEKLCDKLLNEKFDFGILICSTGVGMSISANKIKGIRAALCADTYTARLSRQHNNANVIVLGELVLGQANAIDIVNEFLNAKFLGYDIEHARHLNRVNKIGDLENR